jgi:hypothetical protein
MNNYRAKAKEIQIDGHFNIHFGKVTEPVKIIAGSFVF